MTIPAPRLATPAEERTDHHDGLHGFCVHGEPSGECSLLEARLHRDELAALKSRLQLLLRSSRSTLAMKSSYAQWDVADALEAIWPAVLAAVEGAEMARG